jgi:antitoxin (DNA-binding transcriptional repressor) of toxin-antitoxin stability system
MSAKALTVTEVARHFSDYVSRVAYRNEVFVLCKGKKPVAELRPLPRGRRLGDLPAILRALPHLPKDDAAAFAEDVEAARVALAAGEMRDPWGS